jgi:hypothetical protein
VPDAAFADLETRAELRRLIGVPPGRVVVRREPGPEGDRLVVELAPGVDLPPERRPATFKGFSVDYRRLVPLRIRTAAR